MIRKAVQSDIQQIADIYDRLIDYEAKTVSYTSWIKGVYPTRHEPETAVPLGTKYVYEENGKILASMILNHNQADAYYEMPWKYKAPDEKVQVIHTLCVDPDEKGKGIGKAMVNFAENFAKENGCDVIRIDTCTTNTPAQKMYEKLGFESVGTKHVMHHGVLDMTLLYLEKLVG